MVQRLFLKFFKDIEISHFDDIFTDILLSERYASSKNHLRSMFWVFNSSGFHRVNQKRPFKKLRIFLLILTNL